MGMREYPHAGFPHPWSKYYARKGKKLCKELGVEFRPVDSPRMLVVLTLEELENIHASTDWA